MYHIVRTKNDNKSIIWKESSQYIKSIVTKEKFESMKYKVEKKNKEINN